MKFLVHCHEMAEWDCQCPIQLSAFNVSLRTPRVHSLAGRRFMRFSKICGNARSVSVRNCFRKSSLCARCGCMTLSARRRAVSTCTTSYTAPIPQSRYSVRSCSARQKWRLLQMSQVTSSYLSSTNAPGPARLSFKFALKNAIYGIPKGPERARHHANEMFPRTSSKCNKDHESTVKPRTSLSVSDQVCPSY